MKSISRARPCLPCVSCGKSCSCSRSPVAKNLALSLELFTEGSLDVFSKPTNIRTNSRILSYDISSLGGS